MIQVGFECFADCEFPGEANFSEPLPLIFSALRIVPIFPIFYNTLKFFDSVSFGCLP